jgi:hypothetical protein
VDATAVFSLSTNTVQITLTNLEKNPTADGQLISGIYYTVSGATNSTSSLTTLTAPSGQANIASGGSYTYDHGTLGHWYTPNKGPNQSLDNLTSGGKPYDLIIGPDNNGGLTPGSGMYTNANASITGHDPVVLGSMTFDITVPGVTSSSTLSNVVFQFGTTNGSNLVNASLVSSGGPTVPEPGVTALLASFGLSGVAFLRRRKWSGSRSGHLKK